MSLINLFVQARNSYADWRRRARAYDELMALDDRSLADIGIHRSQIPAIVAGFHRPEAGGDWPAEPVVSPRRAWLAEGHR